MPTLGDVLAAARRSSAGFEGWLAAREPEMASAVSDMARQEGGSVTVFVRTAIADFTRHATEEDWLQLTSRLRASEDPGMVCLGAMIEWRLALAEAHSAHLHHGEGP